MAKIVAGVDSDRAVRYGSMIISAVPATGTLNRAASRSTAPQRAESFSKHTQASRHDASSSRKMLPACHAKMTTSIGRPVKLAEPPTMSEKSDKCACDMKNSEPNGYRLGSATFLIAGT